MFVHVSFYGLAIGEPRARAQREAASPAVRDVETSMSFLLSTYAKCLRASKQLQSVRRHGRDSIGPLQHLVQDQVGGATG